MATNLIDNLYLAVLCAVLNSLIIHWCSKQNYPTKSIYGAAVSAVAWIAFCNWYDGSVGQFLPFTAFFLFVFFLPVGFLAGIPIWWLKPKPKPPGYCQKCGYNLRGNVSGVCPECGEKITADG